MFDSINDGFSIDFWIDFKIEMSHCLVAWLLLFLKRKDRSPMYKTKPTGTCICQLYLKVKELSTFYLY